MTWLLIVGVVGVVGMAWALVQRECECDICGGRAFLKSRMRANGERLDLCGECRRQSEPSSVIVRAA